MLTVNKLIPQGQGLANAILKRAHTLALDWDERQKCRFDATDSAGRQLGVSLSLGTVLRSGDVLVADDGSLIRVTAKPQPVLLIRACAEHGTASDLIRAAYHLGQRHVPVELQADQLKIEADDALADTLLAMHLTVVEAEATFEPEDQVETTGHKHGDDHAVASTRGKPIGIAVKAAAPPHVHGPGCKHDH